MWGSGSWSYSSPRFPLSTPRGRWYLTQKVNDSKKNAQKIKISNKDGWFQHQLEKSLHGSLDKNTLESKKRSPGNTFLVLNKIQKQKEAYPFSYCPLPISKPPISLQMVKGLWQDGVCFCACMKITAGPPGPSPHWVKRAEHSGCTLGFKSTSTTPVWWISNQMLFTSSASLFALSTRGSTECNMYPFLTLSLSLFPLLSHSTVPSDAVPPAFG